MAKKIEDLTFIDDEMFQAVMHEPGVCAEFVERLLHVKVEKVQFPKLEKAIAPFYTTKGVRLDVYLKDENKIIDVEIQKYEQEALGKRTRYYQSMIDMDSLMKGQDYPQLKETYILFICTFDPFKKNEKETYGLPLYTFKNLCLEESDVQLGDNSTKVIYNASAYKAVKDERIQQLLQFISTNNPGEDLFSNKLAELVKKLKENERFRSDYAAMNLHDRDLIRNTKKEVAKETSIKIAKSLFANGASIELISKSLEMTIEQVQEIVKDVSVNLKSEVESAE